jgi:hypothetical protein
MERKKTRALEASFRESAGFSGRRADMSPETIFRIQLILGYVAWLICFSIYVRPRFKAMDRFHAQRAIATLHSFRFFGLVFILPGIEGPNLPAGFATFAAYGDFATGVLAMLALLTARIRPLFWSFVVAFNLVGATDIIVDYYHAIQVGLPAMPGQFGATYAIPIIYVPLLMITHVIAFYLLARPHALGTQPDGLSEHF